MPGRPASGQLRRIRRFFKLHACARAKGVGCLRKPTPVKRVGQPRMGKSLHSEGPCRDQWRWGYQALHISCHSCVVSRPPLLLHSLRFPIPCPSLQFRESIYCDSIPQTSNPEEPSHECRSADDSYHSTPDIAVRSPAPRRLG